MLKRTMSEKELVRADIVQRVLREEMSSSEAAGRLGVSLRQLRRLKRRVQEDGAIGLAHRGRGRASGRALKKEEAEFILEKMKSRYLDFGPTLTAEKLLNEYGVRISRETVRQIQITEGLWKPKRRKAIKYHPRRMRRSRIGELVQIDGSYHDWLEGRGERSCLIVFVDDATGVIAHGKFVEAETTENYMSEAKAYIEKYGRPKGFYSDKHAIFRINRPDARLRGGTTQFFSCLHDLGIDLVCAETPQAKGRVERCFQTLQDRLVKEMRLANICSRDEANAFLGVFLPAYNKKFAVSPACEQDAHRSLEVGTDLDSVFVIRETRTLSNNLDFQYKNVLYQVELGSDRRRLQRQKITIATTLSGQMIVKTKDGKVLKVKRYQEFSPDIQRTLDAKELLSLWPERRASKPGINHPWR